MLFHFHRIHFNPIDPLGDGLRELIASEQRQPQLITLDEEIDGEALEKYWQFVTSNSREDSDQFHFTND